MDHSNLNLNMDTTAGDTFEYEMNPSMIRTYGGVDIEEDTGEDRVLSLYWNIYKLGAAFYYSHTARIFLFPEVPENAPHFANLRYLIEEVRPSVILLSNKCSPTFKAAVIHIIGADTSADINSEGVIEMDIPESRCVLKTVPSYRYNEDEAKNQLMTLQLSMFAPNTSEEEKQMYLSSKFDFQNGNMMKALGGLLSYLTTENNVQCQMMEEGQELHFCVNDICYNYPDDRLFIEQQTLCALQIFKDHVHPSVYKNDNKEGFCIYVIFNRCVSMVGRIQMRKMFMQPLRDCKKLSDRLDVVEFFTKPENATVVKALHDQIKGVIKVDYIAKRMKEYVVQLPDWKLLSRTVNACRFIFETLQEHFSRTCKEEAPQQQLFQDFFEIFKDGLLYKVSNDIFSTIDFTESSATDILQVKAGLNDELDEMKKIYNNLENIMEKAFVEESFTFRDYFEQLKPSYVAQLGFILSGVPINMHNPEVPGLQLKFTSEVGFSYYKSPKMQELDERYGDILCNINDMQMKILDSLQETVIKSAYKISDAVEFAALFDCLIAFAERAVEFKYCRPRFVEENVIRIKGGRHCLQEIRVDNFVPNDYLSGAPVSNIKVITGPNACGKSIYLKQVGIIVFLAQIGSFVPAEAAELTLIDKMFSRIRTMESLTTQASAFAADISQVNIASNNSTSKSLILLDEYGKGTHSRDGLIALASTIRYLKKNQNPHMVVSTHFHGLDNYLPECPEISYMTFDVEVAEDAIVHKYTLKEGKCKNSLALEIGRIAGLPQSVIDRAKELKDRLAKKLGINRVPDPKYDAFVNRCFDVARQFHDVDVTNKDAILAFVRKVENEENELKEQNESEN